MSRPALHVGLVAEGAVEQVIDQLAAHPVLGLGHLALLGHLERDHGRRVLDRHHGQVLEMLRVIDDREQAEIFATSQHGRDDPGRRQSELGEGWHLAGGTAPHHFLQHLLDGSRLAHLERRAVMGERLLPVFVGDAGDHVARQQVEIGVFERDRALDELA